MMSWTAPPYGTCASAVPSRSGELAIKEVSIVGVDLAKQVFQLHGPTGEGKAVFRKKLSRKQFLTFKHPKRRVKARLCEDRTELSTAE